MNYPVYNRLRWKILMRDVFTCVVCGYCSITDMETRRIIMQFGEMGPHVICERCVQTQGRN
jgi:hypothetical protein